MDVFDHLAGAGCTELEIALERGPRTEAAVLEVLHAQFRVSHPGSETEDRLVLQGLPLDREALRASQLDPERYGRILCDLLFGSPDARAAFSRARGAASYLRIRLSFGPSAADLHDLCWELLRDPDHLSSTLLTDPRILFSRYLSSFDWRPVRLRPREALRALVIVADPANLGEYGLGKIDVPAQLAGARAGLAGIDLRVIASERDAAPPQHASLTRILEALREGPDILYIVCHGRFDRHGRSSLFLDDDGGHVSRVQGSELVQALLDLEQRPRLVVLASCEGAGSGGGTSESGTGVLVSLGPRLAEAGIPAVLAMLGQVRVRTIHEFMPVFFREVLRDGIIDRAMSVARAAVSSRSEAWRPVLFMRLKRGRLWYDAGFGKGGLRNWDGIRSKIQAGKCTPIIGPGLFETLFEFRPWLARRWAQEYGFPLASSQHEDLTAVAQFLASSQGRDFPQEKLLRDLPVGVLQRLFSAAEGAVDAAARPLLELFAALRAQRFAGRADPYRILAELPLPLFILGSPDPLLVAALRGVGKRPQFGFVPWRRGVSDELSPTIKPTVQEPLVYFLFGTLDVPESLVLTRDDYFDFLLSVQRPEVRAAIPRVVLAKFVENSLLFLGFQIESWEFRAVFRTIMQQEGMMSSPGPHVAAQIEPEDGHVTDPVRARVYFEDYMRDARMHIYWGSTDGFLSELSGPGKRP